MAPKSGGRWVSTVSRMKSSMRAPSLCTSSVTRLPLMPSTPTMAPEVVKADAPSRASTVVRKTSPLVPSMTASNRVSSGRAPACTDGSEKLGVVVEPLASMRSRTPPNDPTESSAPATPLIVPRSALNAYSPSSGVRLGASRRQGPKWPVVFTAPNGIGLVSDAVNAAGAARPTSSISSVKMSNTFGFFTGSFERIDKRAFSLTSRSMNVRSLPPSLAPPDFTFGRSSPRRGGTEISRPSSRTSRTRRRSTPVRSVVPENSRMTMKGGMSVRP